MLDQMGIINWKYKEHTDWVYAVSWLRDQRLASAGQDKTIRVWDVAVEDTRFSLHEHRGRINSMACSPDGQYLASASEDKTVRIYSVRSPLQLFCLRDHHQPVNKVAWSPKPEPNGDLLLASSGDDAIVRVWRLTTGGNKLKCRPELIFENHVQNRRLPHWINDTGVNALDWSPDGQLIASAGDDKIVRLWRSGSGEEVGCYKEHEGRINALAWSPDGQLIASAGDDRCVHIWEQATANQVKLIPDPQPKLTRHTIATVRQKRKQEPAHSANPQPAPKPLVLGIVTALAWSPSLNSQRLAVASQKDVYIFERDRREFSRVYIYEEHKDWIRTVAWSPDGTQIASAGDDRQVHVWSAVPSPRTPDPNAADLYDL